MTAPNAPSARYRASVVGGTGYGGAELIRLLLKHPSVALCRVSSIDRVGEPLEAVHLNLTRTGLVFEEIPLAEAARGMDVVLLGLPHKVSSTLAPELQSLEAKVIDLSGDFRLKDKDRYASFYGQEHPHPEQLDGRWVFGLPELYRDEIRAARRVASPGCFASSIMLGLLPLACEGLLRGPVQTVAATGSSGSGAYAGAGTHHPTRANNLKIYKPLRHQHTPEVEQILNEAIVRSGHATRFSLHFVPISAPLPRGILANSFVRVPASIDEADLDRMYESFYEQAVFVRVLGSQGRHAEVVAIKGSMWVDLSYTLAPPDGSDRQLIVTTALDNLVKGGAGQAVQSMNLMLGLPERQGIDDPALWP